MASARIAVVGAGLAGLAAATELREQGCTVELFERSRLLGGRATSFEVGGVEVDNGQHVFLACCEALIGFIQRVGMGDHIRMQRRFEALVLSRDGRAARLRAAGLPAPWHMVASFARYQHLGWSSKMRLARALSASSQTVRIDETFAQWLARFGQTDEAVRGFWRPFFVPALNAPLEEISAADGVFVLATAFLRGAGASRFGFTTVPLAQIASAAAARLAAVHLSTPVDSLVTTSDRTRATGLRLQAGASPAYDAVVLALAPPQLARIAQTCPALGVVGLEQFRARAIVDVHLWHDRGRLGFDFAALLESPLQWIFEKADGYLCCSLSAADDSMRLSTDQLVETCWREACAAIPQLRAGTLVRSAVTRNPEATFAPAKGARRPGVTTALENVRIAGSWTHTGWPDTMESAVRSGYMAARSLLQDRWGMKVA